MPDLLPGALAAARLATPDPAAARAFYRAILGWEPATDPGPAAWRTYAAVPDLAAAVARAAALGARVVDAGPDAALLADPAGAVFGLTVARGPDARLAKHDLYTDAEAQAAGFYEALLGLATAPEDAGGFTVTPFRPVGGPVQGVICMLLPAFSPVAYWQPFFAAPDVDAAAARAEALGATILHGPADGPDGQRFAHVRDPQGALFALTTVRGPRTYHGSCACGAVRLTAELDLAQGSFKCGCETCTKARFWAVPVPAAALAVVAGADDLVFWASAVEHGFCRRCGVRLYNRGVTEAGPFACVSLAALDDLLPAVWAAAPVRYMDGAGGSPPFTAHL